MGKKCLTDIGTEGNGETFGLRVSFEWGPSKGPLEFGELGWWELLELLPYDQVYDPESNVEGVD